MEHNSSKADSSVSTSSRRDVLTDKSRLEARLEDVLTDGKFVLFFVLFFNLLWCKVKLKLFYDAKTIFKSTL